VAGDASGIGVMDLATRRFNTAFCDAVDPRFLSMLPGLLAPDATVGTVTAAAAAELGRGSPPSTSQLILSSFLSLKR
jgi:sugar (pentulose or hexulose) kinase